MKSLRSAALLLIALFAYATLAQDSPARPANQDRTAQNRPAQERAAQDRPAQERAAQERSSGQDRGRSAEPQTSDNPQAGQGGGRRGPAVPTVTRVVRLQNANCKPIMEVISAIFRGGVVICADGATRTIVLGASDDELLRRACDLVAELDKTPPSAAEPSVAGTVYETVIEYVSLKLCRADEVVRHLGPIAHAYGYADVVALADERSNTLCLCGPAEGVKKLVAVAREFEARATAAVEGSGSAQQTHFIALKHADARNVANLLAQYFAQLNRRVPVLADDASGQIIAYASEAEAQLVTKIVEALDVPPRANVARAPRNQAEPK
ncbi:MAG: hypothetical protein CHACPFDD_03093 [Phycisphaerae bacterium]|nr:hypothetical protein [Phycisphaerae bacterium]